MGGGGVATRLFDTLLTTTSPVQASDCLQQLLGGIAERSGSGSGGALYAREACHRASTSQSRSLQPDICGGQTSGEESVAACDRSVFSKYIYITDAIQDGDQQDSVAIHQERRLDGIHRSEGCLLSNSHPSLLSPIPPVRVEGHSIPVSSAMFWPIYSTASIYTGHGPYFQGTAPTGGADPTVPRRLATPSSISGTTPVSHANDSQTLQDPGHSTKPRQIGPGTQASVGLPRHEDRLPISHGIPRREEDSEPPQKGQQVPNIQEPVGKTLATTVRVNVFHVRSSPELPEKNEITSDPPQQEVEQEVSPSSGRHPIRVPRRPTLVVQEETPVRGARDADKVPSIPSLHRCITGRLGGHSPRLEVGGPLGPGGADSLHKSSGTAGDSLSTHSTPESPTRFDSSNNGGQHLSPCLPSEPRRNALLDPQQRSPADPILGGELPDNASSTVCSGKTKCRRRLPQSTKETVVDGMDPSPGRGKPASTEVASNCRSVRDEAQLSPPELLQPLRRPYGSKRGRVPSPMGRSPSIRLPTIHASQGSPEQSHEIQEPRGNPHSSRLAFPGVVPGPTQPSCRRLGGPPSQERSAQTVPFPPVLQKPPRLVPSRLASVQRLIKDKGFSSRVAAKASKAHRKSTRSNYQSKWTTYRDWCHKNGHTCSSSDTKRIADFLLFLREVKKLSVSCIKGYRAALSSVFKFSEGLNIGSNPVISDLISAFEKEVPRRRFVPPKWDLDIVLRYLRSPTFEPIQNLTLHRLTQKTAFLLALATAKRVSELQAISGVLGRKSHSLVLHYRQDFLAKTESYANPIPRSFEVPSLKELVGHHEEDRFLCPVRAVRCYRKVTDSRTRPDYLFLAPSDTSRPMTRNALSYIIRQVIWEAHQQLKDSDFPRGDIRTHDLRGIGTSLNFMRNQSIEKVLSAATWRSNSVFASYYLKDVRVVYDNISALGPIVAGGSLLDN